MKIREFVEKNANNYVASRTGMSPLERLQLGSKGVAQQAGGAGLGALGALGSISNIIGEDPSIAGTVAPLVLGGIPGAMIYSQGKYNTDQARDGMQDIKMGKVASFVKKEMK